MYVLSVMMSAVTPKCALSARACLHLMIWRLPCSPHTRSLWFQAFAPQNQPPAFLASHLPLQGCSHLLAGRHLGRTLAAVFSIKILFLFVLTYNGWLPENVFNREQALVMHFGIGVGMMVQCGLCSEVCIYACVCLGLRQPVLSTVCPCRALC